MRRFYVLLVATLLSVGTLHSVSNSHASSAPTRSSKALDREPPAAVYEVEQPERPGYIWAPGCWKWDGKRLVWGPGHWLAKRPGYTWVPDGWEQRADKWYFAEGYWEADGSEPPVAVAEPEITPPVDEVVEAPAPVTVSAKAASTKSKAKKRVVKQPNYSDTKIWIHRRPY